MKRAAQSRPNRSGHRSNFGAASARNQVRAAHNDGNSRSTAPTSPSNWHRRPYPFPMPRRWLDFLYAHAWLTFALMVTFFLCFGITSVNLFILLKMNLDLFVQYGLMVIEDGALEQLFDLIASAILSIIFFLLFKVCERILVERLTAKKFGASVNAPRDAPARKGA
jgi:hypothetical protein